MEQALQTNRPATVAASSATTLMETFFGPATAFRALRASPHTLLPIAAAAVCQLGITLLYFSPNMTGGAAIVNFAIAAVTVIVPAFVVTLWLWVWALVLEDRVAWSEVFSIVAHCIFAASFVALAWAVGEAALDVGFGETRHPVYSSLAFLFPKDDYLMIRIGQTFDIITLYLMVLLTIGVRALFISRRQHLAIALLWLGWAGVNGVAIAVKFFLTR